MFEDIITFIRDIYNTDKFIPLHEPRFIGNEKKYLEECVDTTYVSSVGEFVSRFETIVAEYTESDFAVVVVNGTEALHLSLLLAGVITGDEFVTQPLTFVATANAIQ